MEFRYRDGDIKDPLHHQQRPSPTESVQQAQLQYSSISHPQPRPMEPPYRLLNESFLPSSSSLQNVPFASQMLLVDSTSKETARPVIRQTAPALVSLQGDVVEEQLEDLISRGLESPLQVTHRPVSALASLQRGLISREIEKPLHVLHMQRREMEKERICWELREQIRDEMVEKEQREYAEMRRVLEEEVRQELVMEWTRGVGRAPTVMQPPHQPVLSNFQHQESDFRVTPIHRQEREMGERMGNPQVSMDEQLEHNSPLWDSHMDMVGNELAFNQSDNNFKIAERRVDEELWTEEQPLPTNVQNEEMSIEEQLPFLRPLPANVQDKVEHHSVLQDSPIAVGGNELASTESDKDVDTNDIIAKAKTSNCQAPGIKRYGQGIVESGSKKKRTRDESWTCAVCQLTVTSEKLLNSHIQGKKHKTRIEKFNLEESLIKKTWTCAVCQLTVTSEKLLNSHLQGKKHKTRVEKFNLEESLIKKTDASSASKPDDTPKPTLLQAQDGEIVTMEVNGESHKVIIKNDSLWCEPCVAVCNTREMMASHLRGKKHIQRLKKLKIAIGGAN